MEPIVGKTWKSQTFNQSFLVTSGPVVYNGLDNWRNEIFCGHKANRKLDNAPCLVGLTKKPADYPYDFVVL
jgi:hypothetical protein